MSTTGTDTAALPLTAAQVGVWFAQQFDPGASVYNLAQYLEVHGPVDATLLDAAIRCAERECGSFDVLFREYADGPAQALLPPAGRPLRMFDVSGAAQPREAALSWMEGDRTRPLDLTHDALSLDALFKLGEEHYLWYNRCHHLLVDGFGGALLTRRVIEHYAALLAGASAPEAGALGSLRSLVDDHAAYRSSVQFELDRAYWLNRFADLPEVVTLATRSTTEFPKDFLRRSVHLQPSELAGVRKAAHGARTTWTVMVIAAVAAYLHRMTGADDITIGIPVSARRRSVARNVPAMMANELPLRLRLRAGMTKRDLVREVGAELSELLVRQCYPYDDLRRELRLVGENRQLFAVSVNILIFGEDLSFAGLPTTAYSLSNGPTKDLAITVYREADSDGLQIDFDANCALYSGAEVEAHQLRYQRMLHDLVEADADAPIAGIDLLAPAERHRVLVEWQGAPATVHTRASTITGRFAAQAVATPTTIAVCEASGRTLSYAELGAASDRRAARLIDAGVGLGDTVALLQGRTADMVVSMLAILKAGAAYVPLDDRAPVGRLRAIVADTGARVLVTDRDIEAEEGTTVLRVGAPDNAEAGPPVPVRPDSLAYVMYTSGSTGTPKGVAVSHRSVLDLVDDRRFDPAVHSVVLHHSPQAFDASTYELWVPLLSGGRVVLAPPGDLDVSTLESLLIGHGVTAMWLTAGLFRLIGQEAPQALSGLRQVWTGGDVVPAAMVRRVLAVCPQTTVVDGYGPTETTTFATSHPMRTPDEVPDVVPIGRPLDAMRTYVLGGGLQPVPVGVPGELYLAGAGLAHGYLGRPGLTAERFVADPFGPAGARMYRTGDVVRWSPVGEIIFMGRSDDQVKLRGFRVEPAEIETLLSGHPGVGEVAVVVREDQPGQRRLVAYVVPGAEPFEPAVLREFAAAHLPTYMVPAAVVVLAELPLTANGKLDRRSLPAPELTGGPKRAPRSEREQRLCALFAEVLGVASVGIDDSFFDLGGDSIMSLQLAARARRVGLAVAPPDVFFHQTVAALAAVVSDVDPDEPAAAVELEPLVALDLDELAELEAQWEKSR